MVEFLKRNIRAIVVALLAAGIVVVVAQAGNDTTDTTQNDEVVAESTETQNEDNVSTIKEVLPEINAALPAVRTSSPVQKQDNTLIVVAVEGDNQSSMARKIVAQYVAENNKSLQPGQLLYMETLLVKNAGAVDVLAVGESVSVSSEKLAELLASAESLSAERIAAWEKYL